MRPPAAVAAAGVLWLRCRGQKPLVMGGTSACSVVETASRQRCKHHDAGVRISAKASVTRTAISRQHLQGFIYPSQPWLIQCVHGWSATHIRVLQTLSDEDLASTLSALRVCRCTLDFTQVQDVVRWQRASMALQLRGFVCLLEGTHHFSFAVLQSLPSACFAALPHWCDDCPARVLDSNLVGHDHNLRLSFLVTMCTRPRTHSMPITKWQPDPGIAG